MSETNVINSTKHKCVVYIGDFDLRNKNVQAHLIQNNAKILNKLGYKVSFIGENREASLKEIESLPKLNLDDGNIYLELPNTLSIKGIFQYHIVAHKIFLFLEQISKSFDVKFVITYQSPTFAVILKRIAAWCKDIGAKYIVNCADIPIFESQPFLRRIVMKWNWGKLHRINKEYADGLIAVSRYIEKFYYKEGMPSIIIPPLFDNYIDYDYKLSERTTFIYAGTPFSLNKNINVSGMKDRLDRIIDYCLILSKDDILYRLLVIGVTKDQYTTCIPRHRMDLEHNDDILFLGRYTHDETLKAVKNADYMLNYRDLNIMNEAGLSTKLVESISLGTPVVMNSVGDNFMYLREGITGFELTGDVVRDVSFLKSLSNKTYYERIELKNKCANQKVFSLEKYETELNTFLCAVLGKEK